MLYYTYCIIFICIIYLCYITSTVYYYISILLLYFCPFYVKNLSCTIESGIKEIYRKCQFKRTSWCSSDWDINREIHKKSSAKDRGRRFPCQPIVVSSNGRVNRSISSKWTAADRVSPGPRQLFRFRKIRFRREVTPGTMMIRSSRRRHGRDRGGPVHFRGLWYIPPGGFIKKDRFGEDHPSLPLPFARVGTRWSLRDCGHWQWQQAPREAWLGTARTVDPDLLTRTRADSRSKEAEWRPVLFR